ncbi:tyrosinase cofactor [Streptomyces sp. NPDC048002]|uniref:apotyrosinase chaperone MelC1 n=1 Tax=Streptomyces sp. NPDC048002 TaxID=3154344 RepID=UPI0034075741
MPELSRRRALTAAAALATASTAATLAAQAARADGGGHHGGSTPAPFDEVYQGRRIQGRASSGGGHHDHGAGYAVFVDGVELHVMRNADDSWISVVSHYEPVTTPRAAARAAVDELQGAALLPFPTN